jgi:glucose/arabinose dehydrogenase
MLKAAHLFVRLSAAALVCAALASGRPAAADGAIQVPPGFLITQYAAVGGAGTSLAFGPDTRDPDAEAPRLYVTDYVNGRVVVFDDIGGLGSDPQVFADGFESPLGVLATPNGSVFVADSATSDGPFGNRPYGRVWRLRDRDADGVADKKTLVLKDLPNGRHNTNGMAIGPDGMLYVTNGNSTDDGIEGGQPEAQPWSGSVVRVKPSAKKVSLTDLPRRRTLIATGMRNVYDLAFSPFDRSKLFLPTNGVDDARPAEEEGEGEAGRENSDDLLYLTDVNDRKRSRPRIDDFGFPSCLYNIARTESLRPYNNPHPQVIKEFGRCPKKRVTRPISSFGLHVSADGLAFQLTNEWGAEYKNDLFVAEFGNLFGNEVRGHDVVRVELNRSGRKVENQTVFTNGVTPLDLTFDPSGNLYLLDFTGDIFKITRQI